jgi:serine/threonine protein kinase
MDFLNGGELF